MSEPPTLDGSLDDPAWRRASFADDFLQKEPTWGGEPSRATEVAVAYDDEALYVAARMEAAGPGDVQAVMTRQDVTGSAERIIVSLDTFRDRRTAYSFAVTAAGVRADWYHPDDAENARDSSFDPVWEAEARVTADGWTAEMRIPFSQLRFPDRNRQIWGVNFNRYIAHENEDIFWIPVPKNETGWSSFFGTLVGLEEVEPSRRIEVLPYVAGDVTTRSAELVDDADPFDDRFDPDGRVGLDAKIGLGPSLTLDATINPDFGQVEADPAVVNLTAFETSFEERRPFFVEGGELLAGNGPPYFYSRRIGGAPRGTADGDFVDIPQTTPILGAAKVTGRTPSGLSVGALTAVTGRTHARTFDLDTDMEDEVLVEPLTGYGVGRLQQELGRKGSVVGASFTATARDLDRGEPLADQLPGQAIAGGADWRLRTASGAYQLSGYVGGSLVHGTEPAITALQRSSARYFGRPDADHVELDPDRNLLTGWSGNLEVEKRTGSWRWELGSLAESPGFELNDAGQLFSADDINPYASVRYRDSAPGVALHRWDVGLLASDNLSFGGEMQPVAVQLDGNVTWKNFWSSHADVMVLTPGVSDDLTRGGPLMGLGWSVIANASASNSFSARTQWGAGASWQWSETGVRGLSANADLTIRPVDRLQLSLSPRLRLQSNNRQYVTTEPDGPAATFGSRYVFATIEREELSVQTRALVVFTPEMSLELYAEPFASSGRFSDFGELAAPGRGDLRRYGTDGTTISPSDDGYTVTDGGDSFEIPAPDFTVLSLRSTAVLRWEFQPGSTFFLVWQQDRFEQLASPEAGFLPDSFTIPGAHTVALKLSYWWPL